MSDLSDSLTIRGYRPADLNALVSLITQAFGGETPESVRFAVSARNTTTFVAQWGDVVVGVAMAISFGRTAWIGNVVVSADFGRRGVGSALTETACRAARTRAESVLLLALGDARRLYERLGFVPDGLYGTWTATGATPGIVRAEQRRNVDLCLIGTAKRPDIVTQCLALDGRATGEDRRDYVELFAPAMTVACRWGAKEAAGMAAGYSAHLAWGTGAVIADEPEAARLLLCDLLQKAPATRIELPDANRAGVRLATELGLERLNENLRMRLGPPVGGYRPQAIYKALTPAVG
jgi:predicted N-acetyltransferase YhbS